MVKLYSSTPSYYPEYTHQTELSDVSDEEFMSAWKPRKYLWYHRVFQIICFFLFLGPIRAVIGITVFILTICLIVLIRYIIHKLELPIDTGKRFCISIANFGFRFLLFAFGIVHIKVNGKIDPKTRVFVANHTVYVDPMIISCIHPVTVVMKKEVAGSSFTKYLMEIVDPVFIDRSAHTGASKHVVERANNPKRFPVLIFPEATMNNGDHLLKFHRGAFLSKQKVQLFCIRYWQPLVPHGWNQFAWTTVSMPMYLFEVFSMPFTFVSVDVLDPITLDVEGKGDVQTFTDYGQLNMANHLGVKAITRSSNELFMKEKEE
ncbi:Ancient ubiquitous protein 1 [Tritrichomonas musculus]|uniref:Ancient ubiquitous protein 1 n=1 Tax=Tritrichomonas musculus TaxID=1915356 RepID=A0ABR2GTL1_9EUKA